MYQRKNTFWRPLISAWPTLSDEIVLQIFSNLPTSDLLKASQACRRFRSLAIDNELWKVIYSNFWNNPCIYYFKTRSGKIQEIDVSDTAIQRLLSGFSHGIKVKFPKILTSIDRIIDTGILVGVGKETDKNGETTVIWFMLSGENKISYWGDVMDQQSAENFGIKICENRKIIKYIVKNTKFYNLYRQRMKDLKALIQQNMKD